MASPADLVEDVREENQLNCHKWYPKEFFFRVQATVKIVISPQLNAENT